MNHNNWKTGRGGLGVLFLPVLLLACGILAGGCESDSVTPDDELPQVTEEEAAQQAALVAVGIAKVGPKLLSFNGLKALEKDLGVYLYEFPVGGDISGSIVLEYFSDGIHSHWDDADYGLLYTPEGEMVIVELEIEGLSTVVFELAFALQGDIDQDTDTATVSGIGTMDTGDLHSDFDFTDLILTEISAYPDGGTMDFVAGAISLEVEYDGEDMASVSVNGVITYHINLDTGVVTPVGE